MSRTTPRRRAARLTALGTALVASLATLTLVTPSAQAATLGSATVNPATGDETTYLVLDTAAKCPAGAKTVQMRLSGPGMDTSDGNNLLLGTTSLAIVPSSTGGGYSVTATSTLQDLWQQYGTTAPSGAYAVKVRCSDDSGFDDLGTFDGGIVVTTGASAFKGTYTRASSAQTTTTSLTAGPQDPVAQGSTSTLTATVSPSGAAGTVQMKNGSSNLGSPVAVSGGTAQWQGTLPAGALSLKAVFTPTNASAFASSTSATVSYLVAGTPTITGTVRVGSKVTCSLPAGGTQTFAWKLGTTTTAATTQAVTVPAAWAGKSATCLATVAKGGNQVTTTSAGRTVAKGVFRNTTKPVASGTTRVGRVLTCSKGAWTPTPSAYAFRWLRNGVMISGVTTQSRKLVAADKGKKISCRVSVSKTGYTTATATSVARTVS